MIVIASRAVLALERQEHEAVVIKLAITVHQLMPPARGRLAERELMFIHEPNDRISMPGLLHAAPNLVVFPAANFDHRPGR